MAARKDLNILLSQSHTEVNANKHRQGKIARFEEFERSGIDTGSGGTASIASTHTSHTASRLVTLGAVAHINAHIPSRQRLPIGALQLWIEPAIDLDQCRVFFDAKEQPVGYMTWAYLSASVAKRLAKDSIGVMHPSEWNEGRMLWIMDIAVLDPCALLAAKSMIRAWAAEFPMVSFVRSDRPGSQVERIRLVNPHHP